MMADITMTPLQAIELFRLVANLGWQPLNENDYCAFGGAGPNGRIAYMDGEDSAKLADILQLDATEDFMAVMGGETGDDTQLEFHSVDSEGNPISLSFPLTIQEG